MPYLIASWILAAILAGAALAKLANPRAARQGAATFGFRGPRAQQTAFVALVALELALAGGVAAGSGAAAYGAAALLAILALAVVVALRRGRAGAPCGCFGARSRIGAPAAARNAVLACAFAALPSLPRGPVSTETWLGAGLVLALAGISALAVAVLALAREVGMLRLSVGGQGALEIPEEGPPVGEVSPLAARFALTPRTRLALAVFASEACPMCRRAEPAVAMLARERWLAVETFDEVRHADAWAAAGVPGSPYAVALDARTGTVLAKGTFNGLAQLESILATADSRAPELLHA